MDAGGHKQSYNILVVSSDETERQELIQHLTVSNSRFNLSGIDAIGKLGDAVKGADNSPFSVVISSIELSDAAGKYHRDLDHNIIFDIMCRPLNLPYVYHCVEMSISLDV